MPATPAALREVRDRVGTLQWRRNRLALLGAICQGIAALVAAAAVAILAAGFASPETFGAIAMGGAFAAVAACTAAAYRLWCRWLSLPAAARLADSAAHLQDRLATAVWIAEKAPPPRLAALLVLDALERAASWKPERIEPRRVPPAVVLPPLSLCLLIAALFAVRHLGRETAPRIADRAVPESAQLASRNAAERAAQRDSLTAARTFDPRQRRGALATDSDSAATASGHEGGEGAPRAGGAAGLAASRGAVTTLAGKLQAMILGRRGADAPPSRASPGQLARQPQGMPGPRKDGAAASTSAPMQRGAAAPAAPSARERTGLRTKPAPQASKESSSMPAQRSGTAARQPGPEEAGARMREGGDAARAPGEVAMGPAPPGNAPRAGTAVSPETLFGSQQEGRREQRMAPGGMRSSTFKLALFSVASPDRAAAGGGTKGKGASTTLPRGAAAPLNPEQAEEESMERPQVPVPYENTVRRLYAPSSD